MMTVLPLMHCSSKDTLNPRDIRITGSISSHAVQKKIEKSESVCVSTPA